MPPTTKCTTNAMRGRSSVSSYCLEITNFCSEPIQAVKETADGGMRKNWCGYKNNWLGRLIGPIGSLWQLTVTAKRANRHGIGKIFEFHLIICSVLKLIRSRTGYVL